MDHLCRGRRERQQMGMPVRGGRSSLPIFWCTFKVHAGADLLLLAAMTPLHYMFLWSGVSVSCEEGLFRGQDPPKSKREGVPLQTSNTQSVHPASSHILAGA